MVDLLFTPFIYSPHTVQHPTSLVNDARGRLHSFKTVIKTQIQKPTPHQNEGPVLQYELTAQPRDSHHPANKRATPNLDPACPRQRATTNITMASQNIATYNDCVASLRTSLDFLESSVETLGNGVSDFPRLTTILKSVRVRRPPASPQTNTTPMSP